MRVGCVKSLMCSKLLFVKSEVCVGFAVCDGHQRALQRVAIRALSGHKPWEHGILIWHKNLGGNAFSQSWEVSGGVAAIKDMTVRACSYRPWGLRLASIWSGTTASGQVKVCWAPPQVALAGHGVPPIPRCPQGQIDTTFFVQIVFGHLSVQKLNTN